MNNNEKIEKIIKDLETNNKVMDPWRIERLKIILNPLTLEKLKVIEEFSSPNKLEILENLQDILCNVETQKLPQVLFFANCIKDTNKK